MSEKKVKVLKPLFDKVVLRRINAKKTEGGILLPDALDLTSFECEVVAAGNECKALAQGDVVLVSKDERGIEAKLGQETFLVVSEEDVLAMVEEK